MTQEEKKLLLKDLCARLSYKTFAQWHHKALNKFRNVRIMKISTYGKNIDDYYINVLCQPEPGVDYEASIEDIKPYLRPMSSMTGEECVGLSRIRPFDDEVEAWKYIKTPVPLKIANTKHFDFFHSHHLDWRGLIEKSLALEAPEGMY